MAYFIIGGAGNGPQQETTPWSHMLRSCLLSSAYRFLRGLSTLLLWWFLQGSIHCLELAELFHELMLVFSPFSSWLWGEKQRCVQ
jgi:hypothetical protein